jgi:hypothetical protein
LEFLRSDANNITTFFVRKGLAGTLTPFELFCFISDSSDLSEQKIDTYLDSFKDRTLQQANEKTKTEVMFQNSCILLLSRCRFALEICCNKADDICDLQI